MLSLRSPNNVRYDTGCSSPSFVLITQQVIY